LFGYKEIDIDISQDDNLVVLYGDNGSGKTTVLNLIYHIFSPEPKGGHRTTIGKVTFKSISISLSNRIDIILTRDEMKPGPYHLRIKSVFKDIINWNWFPDDHPESILTDKDEEYKKYCDLMKNFNFSVFYLPANRQIDENDFDNREIIIQESESIMRHMFRENNESYLNRALRQFQQWLRQEMIKRTNVGYRSINGLYNDIIKSFIDNKKIDNDIIRENILNRIAEMKSRNNNYKKYGFSEDFLNEDIINTLRNTGDNIFNQIVTVLKPYLDSIELRLNSLAELQLLLSKFEENINYLFTEKKVTVDVEDGIIVKSPSNILLAPQNLSSGEKQLLLIFCEVIRSWGDSRLIIIDEPEISLNVKWQRVFINSILDIVDRKTTQMFIATHSIEMLSKYEDNIHQLGGKNEDT
jgi:energy-coupling factor transporter ATP-binding protein EcfA2